MLTQPTAYISSQALNHNVEVVRQLAPQSRMIAMVKANAYGHGLVATAEILIKAGVDALGVARLPEGISLRQQGINLPIVLLGGILDGHELQQAVQHDLELVIYQAEQASLLLQSGLKAKIWLKINTGMNRLGLAVNEASRVYEAIRQSPHNIIGIMSHFAGSEENDGVSLQQQLERFQRLTHDWPYSKSLANSAAIIHHPQTHLDWVRPGIMLYGISPYTDKTGHDLGLQPVMRLLAPLCTSYYVACGERIGYNGLYTCPEDMPIGIVRIGYGDGYPRYLHHPASVLINQIPSQVLGRVSMDLIAVDLRRHQLISKPDASLLPPGTVVECWGPELPVEHLATAADTSPYELVAGLTERIEHIHT